MMKMNLGLKIFDEAHRSLGMIGVFPYIYFGLTLLGYLADSTSKEKKWLK